MADLTITAASVVAYAGATIEHGTLGATVTAGQTVYLDAADSKYKLADANSATAAVRATKGLALNGGVDGQPVAVLIDGDVNPGATVTVGGVYVQSATAGGIAPVADLASGHYTTIIGIGLAANKLRVKLHLSGVAVP